MKITPFFSKAFCFGIYDGTLSEAINLFKFSGIKRFSGPLGQFLLGFNTSGIEAVVPVPMSVGGLRRRGFNQSLLLAKAVADNKDIPLIIDGLLKKDDTPPQVGLSAKDRTNNLKGAFAAAKKFTGKRVLLVDDVMTTGAMVNE